MTSLRAIIVGLSKANKSILLIGVGLSAILLLVAMLSRTFSYGLPPPTTIGAAFFGLMVTAGMVYLFLFRWLPDAKIDRSTLMLFLAVGTFARLFFFGSSPYYEDDWYRYLWDGALVNQGVNPYFFTPADVLGVNPFESEKVEQNARMLDLARLAGEKHAHFPERVAYPYLTTIYPPLTQTAFATAGLLKPFSLDAWRVVLLITDLGVVWILLSLLSALKRNLGWVLLYWWNPLAIVTIFNAGHMDVLIAPFLVGAILLVVQNRPNIAAITLAGAAAIKFWPAMLAPLVFRKWRVQPIKLMMIAIVFVIGLVVFLAPMLVSIDRESSGLFVYAIDWQRNAFLFPLISGAIDLVGLDGGSIARMLVAVLVLGFIAYFSLFAQRDIQRLPVLILTAIALLFFLSPTGYPWYAVWLFVLLPFVPVLGIACLTMTLPIYYLRFYFEEIGRSAVFDMFLVPIEFGAPLGIIAYSIYRAPKRRSVPNVNEQLSL